MFSFIYNVFLHFYALYALPKMLFERLFKGKYKKSLGPRFGLDFPQIKRGIGPLIWVHAVSVGEGRAVAPLIRRMREEMAEATIILSCVTESGFQDAVNTLKEVDKVVYLPFDLSYIIRPIVRRLRPELVILSESDLWFNFLDEAKRQGAQVAVVNAKLSQRSYERHRMLGRWMRPFWRPIDLFCVQTELYLKRLNQFHPPTTELLLTGNIKMDAQFPVLDEAEALEWKKKLGCAEHQPLLVIGSTHAPEEDLLLNEIEKVRKRVPNLKTVFVPRHLERLSSVLELFKEKGLKVDLWSTCQDESHCPYILFDVMGKLRQLYQLADLAIVAGSFTAKVGGHNLLEPSYYGVPTLYGPHVFTQLDMDSLVKQANCGKQVDIPSLAATLGYLLENEAERRSMGLAGKRVFQESRGATERTLKALLRLKSKDQALSGT